MSPTDPTPGDHAHAIAPDAMATIVIFGATGDLAGRKLIPAIYNLWCSGYLPESIAVVGVARRPWSDNEFRTRMCEALKKHSRTGHGSSEECDPFVSNLFYHQFDFEEGGDLRSLADRLTEIEEMQDLPGKRLFYLAVGPEYFAPLVTRIGEAGMVANACDERWSRFVIEKPFGRDLASARALNAELSEVLAEDQIYRIDHYLGKETVQNIFAFRFANTIFEPLFNHTFVDHVQITVAEEIGMEGRRGAFYDKTGALRDVVQNHALQLMCLVAMEPPSQFNAKETRDEKVKVLRSITMSTDLPLEQWCVRGQYAEGRETPGYLSEEGVDPDSTTETFVALRLNVDNWRWAGVPFLIRSGKRLNSRVTEIAIQFKRAPTHQFRSRGLTLPEPSVLTFRIQPNEAISLTLNSKPPGMDFRLENVAMDFTYGQSFMEDLPEAYERLLLDAIRGDSTLFMREDEIETAWSICTEVIDRWRDAQPPDLYRPYTWGPVEANRLMEGRLGGWRTPEV